MNLSVLRQEDPLFDVGDEFLHLAKIRRKLLTDLRETQEKAIHEGGPAVQIGRKPPDLGQAHLGNNQLVLLGVSDTNDQRGRETKVGEERVEELHVDPEDPEGEAGTGGAVETLEQKFSRPLDLLQDEADQEAAEREVVDKTDDCPEEVDEFLRGF